MTRVLPSLSRLWRTLWRGDLAVLIAAIAVAMAASTTVSLFTNRLHGAIRNESATVLAADLRLESGRNAESLDAAEQQAQQRQLRTARLTSFTSVVHAGDQGQLATVIATEAGYPLRGTLRTATIPYGPSHATNVLPGLGEAYVDPRLASRLGVSVGSLLRIGATQLRVVEILADRPDRGSGYAEVAPAVLMRGADLAASGLLGPASRATYTLLVAGEPARVDPFLAWLKLHKSAAERLVGVGEASAQLGSAADRAARFLNLAAVTTMLLASIALAMAARRHASQRRDEVALLKCLGATRRVVLLRFSSEMGAAALVGAGIGALIGYCAQSGLAALAHVFTGVAELPAPSATPIIWGVVMSLVMTAGFGLPPVIELTRVPPARVLREDLAARPLPLLVPAALAVATMLVILYLAVRDARLMVSAAIVLSVITGVYVLAGIGLVRLLARVRSDAGTPWRFGVAALARRPAQSVAQLVAFGLGMTILLLLGVVRGDLLEEWRRAVPADAPNHFLINIAPQERDSVEDFFKARQVVVEFAPWVRARLRAVNGTPMAQRMPKSDRGRAFAEREQNLSFRRTLPADNQIVEGHWWPVSGLGAAQVSVATEFRDELDLHLGDRLEFDVAGESVDATLASVRKVRWDGFRPNFFLLFSPGVLDGNVSSYLAAAHLEARVRPDLAEFNRRFPTVTVLDIDGLLTTVRGLVDRAADAVTYVFAFTLLAGLVVLAAAIRATADERRYEGALLRAFGASRRQVLLGAALEFATLGVLAGLVAATAAAAISAFVAAYWLGLPWHLQGLLWLYGPIAGLLGVGGAGLLGTWRMGLIPPVRVLQAS